MDGRVSKDYWILSRTRYYELVDSYCESLAKDLKSRWNEGEIRKGICNLFTRDFPAEKREEFVDHVAYDIMDREKEERKAKLV
jgi:hypothetical protein